MDLPITGMTCASCAAKIEKKLNGLDGVSATVNYATDKATVTYAPEAVEPGELIDAVQSLGYGAQLPEEAPGGHGGAHDHDHTEPVEQARQRLLVTAALAIPVIALSMVSFLLKPPMLYKKVSGVSEKDIEQALDRVLEQLHLNFLPFLPSWEPWLTVLEALAPEELKQVREAPSWDDVEKLVEWHQKATANIEARGGDIGKEMAGEIKLLASQDQDAVQGMIDLTRKVLESHRLLDPLPPPTTGQPKPSEQPKPASQ